MPPLYPKMRERPLEFRINYGAPLAEGLVFAGLGGHGCVGSMVYPDAVVHHNHGYLVDANAADDWVWIPELKKFALRFYEQNYCMAPNRSYLNISHGTWCAWAWRDATTASPYPAILCKGRVNTQYLLWTEGGTWYARVVINGSKKHCGTPYQNERWTHVLGRHDGTTLWIATDGVQRNSTSAVGSIDVNDYGLTVGAFIGEPFKWRGYLADPMVWNRVLSWAEIAALADPSNVDLRVGGVPLILPPRRRFFASVEIPAPTFNPAWAQHVNSYVGLGR